MRDALIVTALSLVPRTWTAWWMGAVARARLSRWVTRLFVTAYGVDMSEAEHGLDAYPTLDALFVRRLRAGARPVDDSPDALVSPVDAAVAWVGRTERGGFEVAPGRRLTVAALLGEDAPGEREVAVLYLSPKDYHRVHVPREGAVRRWRYVPGTLWPVFPAAVRQVEGLFARNERVVATLDCGGAELAVVMVGAFGVGRIEAVFTDLLSNTGAAARAEALAPPMPVTRGGDLGAFHLGSTVVLVAPAGAVRWEIRAGETVRLGRRIGALA
jgi:phosphatidylserine decarboxylase